MPTCKKCGEVVGALEIKEGLCQKCATPENLEKIREINQEELKKIAGIKGWLILVAIGLALNLLIGLIVLIEGLKFGNTSTLIFALVLLGFAGYLNYIFYTKKQIFPKVFIWLNIIEIIFIIIIVLMKFNYMEGKDFLKAFINVLISFAWILYMQKSKRVKATFVN